MTSIIYNGQKRYLPRDQCVQAKVNISLITQPESVCDKRNTWPGDTFNKSSENIIILKINGELSDLFFLHVKSIHRVILLDFLPLFCFSFFHFFF